MTVNTKNLLAFVLTSLTSMHPSINIIYDVGSIFPLNQANPLPSLAVVPYYLENKLIAMCDCALLVKLFLVLCETVFFFGSCIKPSTLHRFTHALPSLPLLVHKLQGGHMDRRFLSREYVVQTDKDISGPC